MKVNLISLFKFPFEDERWPYKFLLGSIFAILPLLNFLTVGYTLRTFQAAIRKEPRMLPEWGNYKDLLILGVVGTLASVVYALPIMALIMLSVSISVLNEMMGSLMAIVIYLFSFGVAIITPFILAAYLENEDFKEVINFRRIYGNFRSCMSEYLKVFGVMFLLMIVSGYIGQGLPFIGIFISLPLSLYIALVTLRAFGELYPYAAENLPDSDVVSSVAAVDSE
jgi:hypothetical protein